jgi:hypothetical protein
MRTLLAIILVVMATNSQAATIKTDQITGSWIGITHQSVIVVTYKNDGTFFGSIQTPGAHVNLTFAGDWQLKKETISAVYKESSSPQMKVPFEDNDTILELNHNYLIVRGNNNREVVFHRANFHRPPIRHKTDIPSPMRLTTDFFVNAKTFEDLDDQLWKYLLDQIGHDQRPYRDRVKSMIDDLSPELKRYFLTRQFDWERGSGGLESCMMNDEDDMFIDDTIRAFDELGAKKQADIIRKLVPIARKRFKDIEKAEKAGKEFNFDPCPFEPFEEQWDKANEQYDFYEMIFRDMKKYPENYCHPVLRKKER